MSKRSLTIFGIIFVAVLAWAGWEYHTLSSRDAGWTPSAASTSTQPPAGRVPCAHHEPLRRVFFGDLHVHTSASMDASSRDMLGNADAAFRFAKGETVGLSPYDETDVGTQPARLSRPLDFAAVTDHSERVGEVWLCRHPGSPFPSPSTSEPGCHVLRPKS